MKNPVEEPLHVLVEKMLRPLELASRDEYRRLSSIKNLALPIENLCEEALKTTSEPEDRRTLESIKALFSGFDALSLEDKRAVVERAICELTALYERAVERAVRCLNTPLEGVKGIGTGLSKKLKKKGLETVEDVLYFLPIRYEDRRRIKKIRELLPGTHQTTCATVLACGEVFYGRRRVFEVAVGDDTGILKLKWFNYRAPYMKKTYRKGRRLILFGQVSTFGGQKEVIHPDVEFVEEEELDSPHFGKVVPVYSQVEGLHQKTLRRVVGRIVDEYARFLVGGMPERVVERYSLMSPRKAIELLHRPESVRADVIKTAKRSLIMDELFALECGLLLKKSRARKEGGVVIKPEGRLLKELSGLLPFELTEAQKRVLREIKEDLSMPYPMNRLLQGDVGSGKTIVSYIAMVMAVESGWQATLMSPTEILAEQHYLSTKKYSERLGIRTLLLTGGLKKKTRAEYLERIRSGEVDIVIGTHALIQKDVEFKSLGLVVIDEQHRFGVVQRKELKEKGIRRADGTLLSPNILVMTATPIPRTLTMTVFGDLDVSIIDELPRGRRPVKTILLSERERHEAYRLVRRELESGGQGYIVYPLVEESQEMPLRDATNMKEHLQRDVFPEFTVGLLHGRMKADEKEEVMRSFRDKKIKLLVSTTVIEVGVDVPDATIIVIEHAERFGLSQLHQLRGRVGRGTKPALCVLLSDVRSEDTWRRLKVIENSTDGFRIAEEDLKIRGPGDLLGTRQSGLPEGRLTELLSDPLLLQKARQEAQRFIERELATPEARRIISAIKKRWRGKFEFAEVG